MIKPAHVVIMDQEDQKKHWREFYQTKYESNMRRTSGVFKENIKEFHNPQEAQARGIEHDF